MANVLCIGGCHWDIRLIAHQALLAGESTPVTSKMSAGGAVSNVARALRSKGHLVEIASVVGNNPPEQSRLSKVLTGQNQAATSLLKQPVVIWSMDWLTWTSMARWTLSGTKVCPWPASSLMQW